MRAVKIQPLSCDRLATNSTQNNTRRYLRSSPTKAWMKILHHYNEELLALIICLSDGTVKEDGFEFWRIRKKGSMLSIVAGPICVMLRITCMLVMLAPYRPGYLLFRRILSGHQRLKVKVVNGATAARQHEWHFIAANILCISDAIHSSMNCSIVWEIILPAEQQGENSKTWCSRKWESIICASFWGRSYCETASFLLP